MADCIQVVNGNVRPSLRYQAPRRAVVVRGTYDYGSRAA